ncbi:MAG: TraB/GumN family protein [Brumimicrobium sp.]|nr:TraB/GumN family protein [Brumimicrobium sp.]
MKKLFVVTLFIVFGFSSFAQNEITSSLLWEISGKKVKSPCYIFGTMHMMPKEDFYFPESLKEKLLHSELLVMEIGGISEQMKGMNLMMLDSGNLFDDFFSKEQLDTLFQYAQANLGMDETKMRKSLSGMKPFVLLQLLSKNEFGENPESYELTFETLAKQNQIPVDGLETIEEQLGFINNMANDQQVKMIMSTIRGSNNDDSAYNSRKLIEIYLGQNIDEIHDFIAKSDTNSEEFEETFLNKRNANWIKPIQKIIKNKKAFIAVGAGHLGGEKGVIQLLKNAGYTLTPIKM